MRGQLQHILFWLVILSTFPVYGMDIDARDAQAILGQDTMTLKRVHSGGSDYMLHLRWNPATDAWETESYEPDHGYGWRPEADMPSGAYWAGSAVAGSKLFVVGGYQHAAKIAVYNSLKNTWTERTVGSLGSHPRAAAVSGKIYIFETGYNSPTTGWIYNITANSLTPLATTFPKLDWTSEPAVYQGKIYFFGGYAGNQTALAATWEFDPATLAFTQKADMPTAGYGASTAVINGKVYVIGGNYRQNKVEVFNPRTNRWVESLTFGPLFLSGWDAAAPLGDKIAIAAKNGATFLFDPSTRQLTPQAPMPRPHGDYITGEAVNGRLYVAGGVGAGERLLDSFKPFPEEAPAVQLSISEPETMAAEPDCRAIEAAHLRQLQLLQQGGVAAP